MNCIKRWDKNEKVTKEDDLLEFGLAADQVQHAVADRYSEHHVSRRTAYKQKQQFPRQRTICRTIILHAICGPKLGNNRTFVELLNIKY